MIPLPIRCGEGRALLVQRAAHRLERHGQPRRLAHGGLGAVLRGPSRTGIQRIEREDEPRRVSLEVMLRGTCDRARLLDLVENFTLFSEHKAGLVKIIGQNHQFLGVNNAIASMLAARKLGTVAAASARQSF